MLAAGFLVYVLVVALLVMFWQQVRGCSFDDLLERSAEEHWRVHRVIAKHPLGGTWAEHQRWMQDEAREDA